MYGKIRVSVLNNDREVFDFTGRLLFDQNGREMRMYDPKLLWEDKDPNNRRWIISNPELTNISSVNYMSFRCIGYMDSRWDVLDVCIYIMEEPKNVY